MHRLPASLAQAASPLRLPPAQAELGELVHSELPEVGSSVTAGETFGVVESVKVSRTGWH